MELTEVANLTSLICMRYARILAMFTKMPHLGTVDGISLNIGNKCVHGKR